MKVWTECLSARVVMMATAALCWIMPVAASLDAELAAYYRFDLETGEDTSGNGLDLTLFGDVHFENGVFGLALAPNGSNDRFAARPVSDPGLNFGMADFTIQAWVNYTDTSGEQILLEKFSGASGPGWTFTKLSNNRFGFANDVGGTPVVQSAEQTIALDTWHHLLIRRSSATYELFYNNVMIASATSPHGSTSTAPLLIGRRNDADGRNFSLKGKIDEIAIWSRSLSDQEIAQLYNEGNGQPIPTADPIFEDRFQQGMRTIDQTGFLGGILSHTRLRTI